jgi:CpeT protein
LQVKNQGIFKIGYLWDMEHLSTSFRNKPLLLYVSILCFGMTPCYGNKQYVSVASPSQESTTSMMIGSFDSCIQVATYSSHYPINLHMNQIWKNHEGAEYLYVEQSASRMPEKRYTQRVYKVTKENIGNFISEESVLPYNSVFIGKCQDRAYINHYGPENQCLREGCALYLKKTYSFHYIEETEEKGCFSTVLGASYTTSQGEIYQNAISSWDQGFNDQREHVWGAEKGPYVFTRKK